MLRIAMIVWVLWSGAAVAQTGGLSLQELGSGGVARHPDVDKEGGCSQITVDLGEKTLIVSYDIGARRALSLFIQLGGEALKVAAAYDEKTDAIWFERGGREFAITRKTSWRPASQSDENEVFLADGEIVETNQQTKKKVTRRVALSRGC